MEDCRALAVKGRMRPLTHTKGTSLVEIVTPPRLLGLQGSVEALHRPQLQGPEGGRSSQAREHRVQRQRLRPHAVLLEVRACQGRHQRPNLECRHPGLILGTSNTC